MRIDIARYSHIVVLTGAGVSAGSGLRTYRSPGGVWEEYNVEEYGHVRSSGSALRRPGSSSAPGVRLSACKTANVFDAKSGAM